MGLRRSSSTKAMSNFSLAQVMADERILTKAAAQEDDDRAALPAPTLGARIIDVPASEPAAPVNSANKTVIDVLDAIPEGSSVSFPADQLAFLLSADDPIRPASEAHAKIEHFARARGCAFLFRQQAGTGTFTKEKRAPKAAFRVGTADSLEAPQAKTAHFLNSTVVSPLLECGHVNCHPMRPPRQRIPICNGVPVEDLMSSNDTFIQNGAF